MCVYALYAFPLFLSIAHQLNLPPQSKHSTASVDKFKEYLGKRFRPEIGMIYASLFFDIMPALSRSGALATDKVRWPICACGASAEID